MQITSQMLLVPEEVIEEANAFIKETDELLESMGFDDEEMMISVNFQLFSGGRVLEVNNSGEYVKRFNI